MQPIGKVIRTKREEKGLSQSDVAKMAGVSRHTISNIENDHASATVSSIDAVAKVFGYELSISPLSFYGNATPDGSFDLGKHLAQFQH